MSARHLAIKSGALVSHLPMTILSLRRRPQNGEECPFLPRWSFFPGCLQPGPPEGPSNFFSREFASVYKPPALALVLPRWYSHPNETTITSRFWRMNGSHNRRRSRRALHTKKVQLRSMLWAYGGGRGRDTTKSQTSSVGAQEVRFPSPRDGSGMQLRPMTSG